MPFFDIESKGQWFYFDPTNEALGGVCLRAPTAEETEKIERITVDKKKKFKRGVWREDIVTNTKLATRMMWDFCIVDWKQIVLVKDAPPADCTSENKVKAVKNWEFLRFCNDHLDELMEADTALEEARAKNSESSSSGSAEEPSS